MKSVLIIFPDEHLPYSPTTLQLAKALQNAFNVQIISFSSKHFGTLDEPFVKYLKIPFLQKKIYGLINKFSKSKGTGILAILKRWQIKQFLKTHSYYNIVATDPISLWMIQPFKYSNLHLLSLELTNNTTNYINKVDINKVKSLLIQSEERKAFLAPGFKGPVFYIQNAPSWQPDLVRKREPTKNNFIFSGTAFPWFGIYYCLDFLNQYSQGKMMVIGKVPDFEKAVIMEKYQSLIDSDRLILNPNYFESEEMIRELSKFRIGFCFYDFSFEHINNINYRTAPSGKLFAYYAAGVPVIGINIPGLQSVNQFNAGVLIDELSPESIQKAVEKIEANYSEMVKGCFKAAQYFDFSSAVKPFVSFLEDTSDQTKTTI